MSNLQVYLNEWDLLTEDEKEYVSNGCGPKFGRLARLVPDFDGLYNPACNLHDWIYWCGGTQAVRKLADKRLKVDMEHINSLLPWWKRALFSWAPRVYYLAVRLAGNVTYYRASYRRSIYDLRGEMKDATI